jgi:hypothetical protein
MRSSRVGGGPHGFRLDEGLDDYDRPVGEAGQVSVQHLILHIEAWLRLNHGSGYRLIKNPADFRNRAVAASQHGGVRGRNSAPHAGQYDLTEINEPQLYSDTLRCYVEDRVSGVPYRVELPWPVNSLDMVRFDLLPQLHDDDEDYI